MAPENCQKSIPLCLATSSKRGGLRVAEGLQEIRRAAAKTNRKEPDFTSLQNRMRMLWCQQTMQRQAAIAFAILAEILQFSCTKAIPPIPDVPLTGLDSDVRSAIEAARKQAVAQPKDGQASGRLGMVPAGTIPLYPPAVAAYQRAILLEPKEFAWRYYLALSLQQNSIPEQALTAISGRIADPPRISSGHSQACRIALQTGAIQRERCFPPTAARARPQFCPNPLPAGPRQICGDRFRRCRRLVSTLL